MLTTKDKSRRFNITGVGCTYSHTFFNMSAHAATEDLASSIILSFTSQDFLYTATVCKSWRRNRSGDTEGTYTNALEALGSYSRVQEALAFGLNKYGLLDLAIVFSADVSVLRALSNDTKTFHSHIAGINYAAFMGNLDALEILHSMLGEELGFDTCELFDAVRGGHIEAVKHIVEDLTKEEINKLPEWGLALDEDDELWCHYADVADIQGRSDVWNAIDEYRNGDHCRTSGKYRISSMDLAIKNNRLDIVRLLRQAGAMFSAASYEYSFSSMRLAVSTGSTQMVQYLRNEGLVLKETTFLDAVDTNNTEMLQYFIEDGCVLPDKKCFTEHFQCEYFPNVKASSEAIEFLLDRGVVEPGDIHIGGQMLKAENRPIVDLLLRCGYSVTSKTVDAAIAQWDFDLACSLMLSSECQPTGYAYKCLMLQGFHYQSAEFEYFDFDICMEKLEWLHSIGCRVEFESFAEMCADNEWHWILEQVAFYTDEIEQFFRDHLPSGDVAGVVSMEVS